MVRWRNLPTKAELPEYMRQVARLRDLIGAEKPVLFGQYMWDFGGKKPMPGATMANQLAQTSRLLAAKAIHGVIFHCTPLVDMNLDAVNVSREWIRANADRPWGDSPARVCGSVPSLASGRICNGHKRRI